ncbi:hypothetical protein JKF63_00279 [Porcisia hertigi]|uniref:Uncharacterized protein n=1 Tax=Porcisia hertigi TaxID=2761500 RepID=A0A836L0X7_9TRYP|nr:hypothetical protein JKF63_00279 [Porcisia hertigi]
MSSIFVLIRPHAWSPAVCDRVRRCITNAGARIDAEDTVPSNTLLYTSTLEKYFGSIHYWAISATDAVLRHPLTARCSVEEEQAPFCAAEEDLKSLFYQRYGELWDTALDEGRLRTALDVIQKDDISATELASRCASTGKDAVLTLPLGLTITRLLTSGEKESAAQQHYVVNGTYPAELEVFRQEGGGATSTTTSCWWCAASWPSLAGRNTSQKETVEQIIKLPRTLSATVSTPHGIDIFTGALETVSCRVCWMNTPLHYDSFVRLLIQRGLPLPFVAALLRDPTLHSHGHFTSVFDMVAGKDDDDVARALTALYDRLRFPDNATEDGNALDGSAALYDWQNGCFSVEATPSGASAEKFIPARTHAVALVHPRLWSRKELVQSLEQQLNELEVCIEAVREVSAEELVAKLDLHHGDVARYALDQEALRRFAVDEDKTIAAQVITRFENKCGVPWEIAMQEGRIWSASLAEHLLGAELAGSLLKHCCVTSAHTTHQLSRTLSITELSREVLMTQLNPKCPIEAVSSARDCTSSSRDKSKGVTKVHRPYSLTSESYFIVNAMYALYRRDILGKPTIARAHGGAAGLLQLSWQDNTKQPDTAQLCTRVSESLLRTPEPGSRVAFQEGPDQVSDTGDAASSKDAVTESVCAAYPFLQIINDAFSAMRARHLWWGIPYEDDVMSRDLVCSQGRSWLTLHEMLSASMPEGPIMQEAVLALLPPVAATAKTIELTLATLEENGVALVEQADLFGNDAFEYVFSGSTAAAMARQLAQKSGASLWAMMSVDMQVDFRAAALALAESATEGFTPDRLYGGSLVCSALRIPPGGLEDGWRRTKPLCVSENCWLGYLAPYKVWVVNGHIPLLESRYRAETARVHLLRIQWDASTVSWDQMQNALVGQCSDTSEGKGGRCGSPAAGSLTQLLSSIADRSPSNTRRLVGEPLYVFSASTYHALVDVLRWPRAGSSGPLSSEVAMEDWLMRQPNVQSLLLEGTSTLAMVVQQVRETLETALPLSLPLQQPFSSPPCWMLRFAHLQRAVELHYGFIWLHPSSTTPAIRNAVPELLLAHGVGVRASGVVPLEVALQGELLDVLHDPFFKNAYIRKASEVPITDTEARTFAHHFDMDWIKAVQLGIVLNAKEAEQKYGTVHMLMWWDSLTPEHQVKLSDSLFVGYMAKEGLYVMNVPYTYRRSRLHTGSHEVVWYAVEWSAAAMSWDGFLKDVIGDADPATAAAGSLRQNFATHWTQYSLPGKPDEIECVLHASESPLAALAERCRWLAQSPTQDPYGRRLLQSGVSLSLLTMLLNNPSVYNRATGLMMDAFKMLPQEDTHALVLELRNAQCTCTAIMMPDTTRFVPPSTALATPPSLVDRHSREVEEEEEEDQASLTALEDLSTFYHTTLASGIDPFVQCAFATAHGHELSSPSSECFAVLYLDPTCVSEESSTLSGHRAFRTLLEQQLRINGIHVVHERVIQCASAAEASVLYRSHHHRQYRYGVAIPATESLDTSMQWQLRFKQRFGVPYTHSSVTLYNAAEMSRNMQITEREVASLWRRSRQHYSYDTVVMGEGCVIQKLHPGKPFYVMNGDVMEAEHEFVAAQSTVGVRVWLLAWDPARVDMGYLQLQRLIADLQAPSGVLRQWWTSGGGEEDLSPASKSATGDSDSPLLHVSESSIAAVRQRQLWWQLPVWSDPTVATWMDGSIEDEATRGNAVIAPLSAHAVAWALGDPLISVAARNDNGPVYLWDTAVGMGTLHAGDCIRRSWAAAVVADERNDEGIRNTAVVTLAPQVATNSAVCHLVRSVLLEKGLRIEAHGFIADHGEDAPTPKLLVQYLYPEDWRYSIEDPNAIQLNADEAERVAHTFGTSWEALLDKSQLLPASWATKRLGGMTAPHLRLFTKTAKSSLWVRPHLHVAHLAEYGVCVINAHIPYLAHTIAATINEQPLPYYVVSWSPSLWSWKECITQVFGSSEPSLAEPGSIRGRLHASWPALGLHAAPERAEGGGGGVCVSEGPLESLLTRLHVQWPPLDCFDSDTAGSFVLQQQEASGSLALLHAWLRNPVVTCDGYKAGVFSHLAFWDTRELLQFAETLAMARKETSPSEAPVLPALLAAAQNAHREAQARHAAQAVWERALQGRYNLPTLCTPTGVADTTIALFPDNATECEMLYRNNGTLLFFSDQLGATQRAQLRQHLLQHGITVTAAARCEEGEQECTAALLDRLYATEAFFADCHDLAAVLLERGEVAVVDQDRFNAVFREEVPWSGLLAHSALSQKAEHDAHAHLGASASDELHQRPRIYSAADAMKVWNLTPHELWTEVRQGVSMRVSEGIEVTRLPSTTHGHTRDADGRAVVSDTETSWRGHYVVNGLYAAVRASLQAPTTQPDAGAASPVQAPPRMTKWNVNWDSRSLSWHDFYQNVIGYPDGAHAASSSFNAFLTKSMMSARESQERNSDEVPSPLSCVGVMAASGPLAAFAVRRYWSWNANHHDVYLPDPFLRAVVVAGMDHDVVLNEGWLFNPVMVVAPGKRMRLFDWTRGCDTLAVLDWMHTCEQMPTGIFTATTAARNAAGKPSHDLEQRTDTVAPTAAAQRCPPPPPPRLKTHLQTAWVRDALLHARTDAEYEALWQHYRTLGAAAAVTLAVAEEAAPRCTISNTIPFALFYRDFKSLDKLGVRCISQRLKHLFIDIETRRRGCMSYAELTHALTLYHSL